jgi:hypothetical protein
MGWPPRGQPGSPQFLGFTIRSFRPTHVTVATKARPWPTLDRVDLAALATDREALLAGHRQSELEGDCAKEAPSSEKQFEFLSEPFDTAPNLTEAKPVRNGPRHLSALVGRGLRRAPREATLSQLGPLACLSSSSAASLLGC